MNESAAATGENRLATETSPYLLQHKDNPVHWHPWDETALTLARETDKPILLSVGYAACHWCHVMAHECFENSDIADLMNREFINIKVDREERPDIDAIYQSALALLGEHGGWPLTMFLTPDAEPFWGGTYFPPTPRFGRPGFPQVLQGIAGVYRAEPEKVAQNVGALKSALTKLSTNNSGTPLSLESITNIAEQIVRQFDPFEGGMGTAPKFPQPSILKLLWRAWKRTGSEPFRQAVELTLTKMCQGGIYDHLGGGFARYSVDNHWLVPHFEKMLYDNAQLIQCLTWAWQDTGNPLYDVRVRETVNWVLREMIADADDAGTPAKAFAATLDADSEGEEGKFYVWSEAEIDRLLGAEASSFKETYDVTAAGNWEGRTILNRSRSGGLKDEECERNLALSREKLLAARAERVRPGWDDKVLADWNGLMIAALAEAARVFRQPDWLGAAETAFDFVARECTNQGRLRHSWRRGRLRHPATLDDYANMAEAAIALYEATAKKTYLAGAEAWIEVLDHHYWDQEQGGYFFTADDTTGLLVRSKSIQDNATPSGNATLIGVLAKLFFLTGKEPFRQRAEALVESFSGEAARNAFPLATFLAQSEFLMEPLQVVIVGEPGQPETNALLFSVYEHCLPNRVLMVISPDESLPEGHPAQGRGQIDGKVTVYICRGMSCSLPITEPESLAAFLTTPPAPLIAEGVT